MVTDLTLKAVLNILHTELCRNFAKACKARPTAIPDTIPEARDAMREIREFDFYVEKYFGLVYDTHDGSWREVKESMIKLFDIPASDAEASRSECPERGVLDEIDDRFRNLECRMTHIEFLVNELKERKD